MHLELYNRLFRPLLFRALLKSAEKKAEKCEMCKGKMIDATSYLYLISAKFGEEHIKYWRYYGCEDAEN